jgi:hypothetical protein
MTLLSAESQHVCALVVLAAVSISAMTHAALSYSVCGGVFSVLRAAPRSQRKTLVL